MNLHSLVALGARLSSLYLLCKGLLFLKDGLFLSSKGGSLEPYLPAPSLYIEQWIRSPDYIPRNYDDHLFVTAGLCLLLACLVFVFSKAIASIILFRLNDAK